MLSTNSVRSQDVERTWEGATLEPVELDRIAALSRSLATTEDRPRLQGLLGECADLVGADRCIAVGISRVCHHPTKSQVINHSYPEEWLDIYESRRFGNLDPVFLSHLQQGGLQCWKDVYRQQPPCPQFLGLANDFGLVDGITNGLMDLPKGARSMVSYAGKQAFGPRERLISEVLVAPIHFAVTKVIACPQDPHFLTPRELEILRWVSVGKTSWEISRLHSISERTVKFHLGNIFRKLGVTNRAQAIGTALQLGIPLLL